MIGIYKITSPTNRVYIGQSNNIKLRFAYYRKLKCKTQPKIYRSLIKHGVDNHTFEVIEECELYKLNERERHYQELFNCLNNGLNCTITGTLDKKFVHSDISKSKISKSRIGIIFTDIHRDNIRKVRTGTTTPQKTKDILRIKSIAAGCKPPSWKGKIKSREHMENIAKKLRGRVKSDIENKNTSNAMLNTILPYSRVVFDPLTGVCYHSISDAARCLKYNVGTLIKHISKGKTHLVFA